MLNKKFIAEHWATGAEDSLKGGHNSQKIENHWFSQSTQKYIPD